MNDAPATGSARIAAIDIGSNTTRLMVADVTRDAAGIRHTPIVRESRITRLAEGVDARGMLLPVPVTRTRNALTEFRAIAREHGAVYALASATSAVRDSDNGEAFLGELEYTYGFDTELLAGRDEASWTWRGVTSDPALAEQAATGSGLLVDIGGGSTEIVLTSDGVIRDFDSLQLGSVRLTEQELAQPNADGSWSASQVAAATDRARSVIRERFPAIPTPDLAIGVAGTVTTVAAITLNMDVYDSSRIHRTIISQGDIIAIRDRIASMSIDERRNLSGLEPQRAEVITGGLCILTALCQHAGIDTITVSECDILDGVALQAGEHAIQHQITEMPEPFGRTSC